MNWVVKNFLRGLVIVVPIAVTVWVIVKAFTAVDQLLLFRFPGLGAVVIVGGTILIGALASNFVIRKLLALTDALFTRAPIVRIVYSAIRDLLEAFVGERKRFDKPVAVTLSETVSTLGFVTQDDLGYLAMEGRVAVYLPLAYSMAGLMITVPASAVKALDADGASVMALVVSGGVSRV